VASVHYHAAVAIVILALLTNLCFTYTLIAFDMVEKWEDRNGGRYIVYVLLFGRVGKRKKPKNGEYYFFIFPKYKENRRENVLHRW